MSRKFLLWFLLTRALVFAATPNVSLEDSSSGSPSRSSSFFRFSRLLKNVFCCTRNDSVILPREMIPLIEQPDIQPAPSRTAELIELDILLSLNPGDCKQVNYQHELNFDRSSFNKGMDHFTFLTSHVRDEILNYLVDTELRVLRSVNRLFLLDFIIKSRTRLMSSLKPRITRGYYMVYASTLSASLLMDHLSLLLKKRTEDEEFDDFVRIDDPEVYRMVLKHKLICDTTDHLQGLLYNGLFFLRHTDLNACLDLLECLIKSRIFSEEDYFITKLNISPAFIYLNSCKMGHLCLLKTIFEKFLDHEMFSITSGLVLSVKNDFFLGFKHILTRNRDRIVPETTLKNILSSVVRYKRLNFLKLLAEIFPIVAKLPHLCLFTALEGKDMEIIKFLLELRGDLDFDTVSQEGLNVVVAAARSGQIESLNLLFKYPRAQILLQDHETIQAVLYYKCFESFKYFLSKITLPIDQYFDKMQASVILVQLVSMANLEALELVLKNINTRTIEDFLVMPGTYDMDLIQSYRFMFQTVVEKNFQNGFEVLINHFGTWLLEVTDNYGRDIFTLAMIQTNIHFVRRIAELIPEKLNRCDVLGNNSLHLMLAKNPSIEFLKEISVLNLNWNSPNHSGTTPFDMLNGIGFTTSDLNNIYRNIFKRIF